MLNISYERREDSVSVIGRVVLSSKKVRLFAYPQRSTLVIIIGAIRDTESLRLALL